jgi:hypothetical protein
MGQHWMVTCPDQRRLLDIGPLLKLGENFPAVDMGRHLEEVLMVPLGKQLVTPSTILPDLNSHPSRKHLFEPDVEDTGLPSTAHKNLSFNFRVTRQTRRRMNG